MNFWQNYDILFNIKYKNCLIYIYKKYAWIIISFIKKIRNKLSY